jgi:ketosteroid isomerase-like protein
MTVELVLQVNEQFYRALSMADFAAMERLWLESADAVCVHPGWTPLYGWEAIRESWKGIFENQGPLRIWPSEAQVRLFGQTAEVNCLENIDTGQIQGAGIMQTRARNIYRRVDDGLWKMLEHYAAPMRNSAAKRLEPFSSN